MYVGFLDFWQAALCLETSWPLHFLGDDCHILKNNILVKSASKTRNIYILNVSQSTTKIVALIQKNTRALFIVLMFNEDAVELWHRRIRHLNEIDLKRLVNISKNITLTQKPRVKPICETYSKTKSSRKVSRRQQREILEKLDKVHIDLRGPFNVSSVNEVKYYMLLTNQATLRIWYFTYKHKNETFKLFRDWKTQVKNELEYKLKIVRIDNDTEFINDDFKILLKNLKVIIKLIVTYTSKQNGLSEV